MNRSNEAKLAQLAAYTLEMRAKAIREGAADPAVEDLAAVVKSRFDGDLEAATKSLIEELSRHVQTAKDADRAARERRQWAWNTLTVREMAARRYALLDEAERCQSRAKTVESEHKTKVDALKAQGFSASEIAGVLELSETASAEELKKRHAELLAEADAVWRAMEQHVAAVLAEGLAP
ncbi:hypothetical protein SAMN04244579_03112 [Azotobacter beijerinckii]|uniref:Uncharacterized protein n=1 Tax=Azotobacter beijerinckii TaxID=170623 RepID=A0A1H6WBC0_9GAMM|nr:hypothetical protein [Azotobacter beijerinckii]SEJ09852.1 hypothetical protein SAMN04244579_03112 [Azotobacter beijerinckii]